MPISSASCNFNWKPTNFSLSDLEDNEVNFYDSFGQNGLLVMFIGVGQMIAGYVYPNQADEINNAVENFEKK